MMTIKMQLVISIVFVVFFVLLMILAKKKAIDLKYILAWTIIDFSVLFLALIPRIMTWISELIGVFSPVNTVFFIGFLYLGFIVFLLSIAISRLSVRMKKLIQEIALLKRDIDELKK